ncbi:hypothetical protein Q7P37_001991 [Cladosporium fusiforme]
MRTYDDTFSGRKIYPGKVCGCPDLFPRFDENANGETEHGMQCTEQALGWIAPPGRRAIWEDACCRCGEKRWIVAEEPALSNTFGRKGKIFVRSDSKIFRFQNGKSESLFLQRKNPRKIAWTVLCRRQRRKGISEEAAKSRRRRQVKSQRAIVGASLDVIKERRSQRPEARSAARQAAIKEGKEKRTAAQSVKKAEKAKTAAKSAAGQSTGRVVGKQGAKGAASKPKPTSR